MKLRQLVPLVLLFTACLMLCLAGHAVGQEDTNDRPYDGNQVRSGTMKPEIKYLDDRVRGMMTEFMNDAAASGREVYCNNKGDGTIPAWQVERLRAMVNCEQVTLLGWYNSAIGYVPIPTAQATRDCR